jgi:hypothetical protein
MHIWFGGFRKIIQNIYIYIFITNYIAYQNKKQRDLYYSAIQTGKLI